MKQGDIPEDLVLTESQFREVIERATRADLRDPGIPLDVLRQVAAELEIDPKELQLALRAVLAVPDSRGSVRGWLGGIDTRIGHLLEDILPRKARPAVGALAGGSLGWLSAHVAATVATGANAFIDVPVAVALVLLTGANSLSRRLDGRFAEFVGETVAMWAAFGLAWTLTFGEVTGDIVTWVSSCVAAATVWGWLVVRKSGPDGLVGARAVRVVEDGSRGSEDSDHARSPRTSARDSAASSIALALASLPRLRRNEGTV